MNTPIDGILTRYLAIQHEEVRLNEEKEALRKQLAAFMAAGGKSAWTTDLAGRRITVRCRSATRIDYDEALLSERLGDRYRLLLKPDVRKIRANLDVVAPHLAPIIEIIGSPAPDQVKQALESGEVSRDDFSGAFTKRLVEYVSVTGGSAGERTA